MKILYACLQRLLGRSDVYFANDLYMRRWRILDSKSFGLRVHHIVRSDADRELHDHPFTFVSVILRCGYWEHTADGKRTWYGPGSIVVRSGEVLHRLELSSAPAWRAAPTGPRIEHSAWTLVFRGARRREWGFLPVAAGAWQGWEKFTEKREAVLSAQEKRPYAAPSST